MQQITKGYELSRIKAICPIHGFQEEVRTDFKNHRKDIFGMNTDYGLFCLKCNNLCKEERQKIIKTKRGRKHENKN